MAKKSNAARVIVTIIVLAAVGLAAYAWLRHRDAAPVTATATSNPPLTADAPLAVASDKIVPSHEGRTISVDGTLEVRTPARDTQLGVTADAVMLMRYVEMHQWYEQCAGGQCEYKKVWSPQLIRSEKFREKEGHKNPERIPLQTARFSAGDVRLGAFRIDAATIGNFRLSAALNTQPVAFPVTSSALPANLAISFRDFNGALYGGNDPAHPAIGDVRVSYRIIPATDVHLTGIQRGDRLMVQKATSTPAQTSK